MQATLPSCIDRPVLESLPAAPPPHTLLACPLPVHVLPLLLQVVATDSQAPPQAAGGSGDGVAHFPTNYTVSLPGGQEARCLTDGASRRGGGSNVRGSISNDGTRTDSDSFLFFSPAPGQDLRSLGALNTG